MVYRHPGASRRRPDYSSGQVATSLQWSLINTLSYTRAPRGPLRSTTMTRHASLSVWARSNQQKPQTGAPTACGLSLVIRWIPIPRRHQV